MRRIYPLLMVVLMVFVASSMVSAEESNLIRNSDFSVINPDTQLPAEWFYGVQAGEVEFSVDTAIFKEGTCSLRMDGLLGKSRGQSGQHLTADTVIPGKTYRLSVWYRTKRIEATPTAAFRVPVVVRVRFRDSANKDIVPTQDMILSQDPSHIVIYNNMHFGVPEVAEDDWKMAEMLFKVPETMANMFVEPFLMSTSGTVWWDDIQLTMVD
jgi:hypothetical protein